MPELPEVETVKEKLRPLKGRVAESFYSRWPRGLKIAKNAATVSRDIKGRMILGLRRLGKALLIALGGKQGEKRTKRLLAFHLRMSGRLNFADNKQRGIGYQRTDNKHIRAGVKFKDGSELYFNDPRKFGVIWYGKPEEVMNENYFSKLGFDARGISLREFKSRLFGHRGLRPRSGMIKPLLMRQDLLAGIGNIVADETLWEAKIHPKRSIKELRTTDIKNLHRALQKVLERGIKAGGATLRDWKHPDGTQGEFKRYMKVYGRKGEPCLRCRTKIRRIVVGGRGTWICIKCQKP